MHGTEILHNLLQEHATLRARLQEWDGALHQASGTSYEQCQEALRILRNLCRVFEHQIRHHFREEETVLYAAVEFRFPRLRAFLGELRHEHDVVRQVFDEFHRELIHFNASGDLRHLPQLGRELIRTLLAHIDREEFELHPLILREFREDDWREVSRLYVESEVA